MTRHLVMLSTCPDKETGTGIASRLVSEQLAACVNIVPGLTSVYQWKDEINTDQECLLIIKTRKTLYKQVEQRIRELHPYELPEVVAVDIMNGLDDYLAWIDQNTIKQNIKPKYD